MSRVAKDPITLSPGVDVNISGQVVTVKGGKGTLERRVPAGIQITKKENTLCVAFDEVSGVTHVLAGTIRALINNMVIGVSKGFERALRLIGVGYRAQIQGKMLNLNLGFSHPIQFRVPEGITIETPSQTDVVVKGIDKQLVGQVAANIRAYRPPEPYKGKGVRYVDEIVIQKEAKKK